MGLLVRLVVFLVEAFTAIYVLVATIAFFVGLARFLFELPGALRKDIAKWKRQHTPPPRPLRYVVNEAEFRAPALPPPPDPAQ